jgi:hypothetical protein
MRKFGQQLEEKLRGDIDATILEWIWDRLAETGPYGKYYTDRFREQFRGSFVLAESPPAKQD